METFSKDFKKVFLFAFTKELIKNSIKNDSIRFQKIFESKEKEPVINLKERQESEIQEEPLAKAEEEAVMQPSILSSEMINEAEQPAPIKQPQLMQRQPERKIITRPIANPAVRPIPRQVTRIEQKPHLFIPELKLPPYLEYLKPIPNPGIEIDLSKLNPLIKDPAVRIIEVNPDERVMVTGTMGTKPTEIILSKEDIDRVINKFSEITKIPTNEGVYRVVAGNLILSGIISNVIGSKFVIKKMMYPNPANMQGYPPFMPKRNY